MKTSGFPFKIARSVCKKIVGVLPDRQALQILHLWKLHALPRLENPQTFSDKIAWRKLYQRDPRFTLLTDKVTVKEQVAKIIGETHIIPTLWTGEKPEDIPFNALVPPYVIKVNHSSGSNLFVRDAKALDKNKIYKKLRQQLRYDHSHTFREWGYKDIPRKILVERMIQAPDGDVPEDYKIFVYHEKAHFIEVDVDRFKGHKCNIYDLSWKKLPFMLGFPNADRPISRPALLEEMIGLAEKIGATLDFVRVDFYCTPTNIFFGEMTIYPGAGYGVFIPVEWDYKLGEPWHISRTSN
jgi:hypothetical protein